MLPQAYVLLSGVIAVDALPIRIHPRPAALRVGLRIDARWRNGRSDDHGGFIGARDDHRVRTRNDYGIGRGRGDRRRIQRHRRRRVGAVSGGVARRRSIGLRAGARNGAQRKRHEKGFQFRALHRKAPFAKYGNLQRGMVGDGVWKHDGNKCHRVFFNHIVNKREPLRCTQQATIPRTDFVVSDLKKFRIRRKNARSVAFPNFAGSAGFESDAR